MDSELYALMGNPVKHSLQPDVFRILAKTVNQTIDFEPILIETDLFPQSLEEFLSSGGAGIMVGNPLKREAMKLVDEYSARAGRAGAVNVITKCLNGELRGDMTTGVGFVIDVIENTRFPIKNKNVLILGAGSAARSILGPILRQKPSSLMLVDLEIEMAQRFEHKYRDLGGFLAGNYNELEGKKFDLVINATSTSHKNTLPPLPDAILNDNALCYEMAYNISPKFLSWAKAQDVPGCICKDGLGTLVESCAEAYAIWREVRPNTTVALEKVKNHFASLS